MARMNTRPSSRYDSETPVPANTSDQENHDPQQTRRMDKGKGRATDSRSRTRLPTPSSDSSNEAHGQKRKRAVPQRRATQTQEDDDDLDDSDAAKAKFTRYFDPNQDPEVRREIKRKSRALEREFQGRRAYF